MNSQRKKGKAVESNRSHEITNRQGRQSYRSKSGSRDLTDFRKNYGFGEEREHDQFSEFQESDYHNRKNHSYKHNRRNTRHRMSGSRGDNWESLEEDEQEISMDYEQDDIRFFSCRKIFSAFEFKTVVIMSHSVCR